MNIQYINLPRASGKTTMALAILMASKDNYYFATRSILIHAISQLKEVGLNKDKEVFDKVVKRMFDTDNHQGLDVLRGKVVHTIVIDELYLCRQNFMQQLQILKERKTSLSYQSINFIIFT